jgi:hypothetical protein
MQCYALTSKGKQCSKKGIIDQYCCIHYIKKHTPTCSICLDEIFAHTRFKKTSCNHIFHHSCWEKLIKTTTNCPICRIDISKDINQSDTSFVVTLINDYDEALCLNFDAELIFGKKGLKRILKRKIHHRPHYIIKKCMKYHSDILTTNNEDSTAFHTFCDKKSLSISFGKISSDVISLSSFPHKIQKKLFEDGSIFTMIYTIYEIIYDTFHDDDI